MVGDDIYLTEEHLYTAIGRLQGAVEVLTKRLEAKDREIVALTKFIEDHSPKSGADKKHVEVLPVG